MKKFISNSLKIFSGVFIGFINGFFGGGGGMLCVPLLEKVFKLETKKAHATAILIILPICITSAITYMVNGNFNLSATLNIGVGVILGGIIGATLLNKLNSLVTAVIFSLLMILAGIKMVV